MPYNTTHDIINTLARNIAKSAAPELGRVNVAYANSNDDPEQGSMGAYYNYNNNAIYAPEINSSGGFANPRNNILSQSSGLRSSETDFMRNSVAQAFNIEPDRVTEQHAALFSTLHEYGHAYDMGGLRGDAPSQYVNYAAEQQQKAERKGYKGIAAYKERPDEMAADWNAEFFVQHAAVSGLDLGGLEHGWTSDNLTRGGLARTEIDNGTPTARLMVPNQGMLPRQPNVPNGLAPIDSFDASHIGHPARAYTRAVANDLRSGGDGRASSIAAAIGAVGDKAKKGVAMASQAMNGMLGNNIANVEQSRKTSSNQPPITATIGGVKFRGKPGLITSDADGNRTTWKVRTSSGVPDEKWEATAEDKAQAELYAHMTGAQNSGVVDINSDIYNSELEGKERTDENRAAALQRATVGRLVTPRPDTPSANLAGMVNSLNRIASKSRAANGIDPDDEAFAFGIPDDLIKSVDPDTADQMQLEHAHDSLLDLSEQYTRDARVKEDFGRDNVNSVQDLSSGLLSTNIQYANFIGEDRENSAARKLRSIKHDLPLRASRAKRGGRAASSGGQTAPSAASPVGGLPLPERDPSLSSSNLDDDMSGGASPKSASSGSGELPLPLGFKDITPSRAELAAQLDDDSTGLPDRPQKPPLTAPGGRSSGGGLSSSADDLEKSVDKLTKTFHGAAKAADTLTASTGAAFGLGAAAGGTGGTPPGGGPPSGGGGSGGSGGGIPPGGTPPTITPLPAQPPPFGNPPGPSIFGAIQGAAMLPIRAVNARWAIRGAQQEFIDPLESARQGYLSSQRGNVSDMMRFDAFGGQNIVGSESYNNAFGSGIASQNQQNALGRAAQRAYGGLLSGAQGALGDTAVAQGHTVLNMASAGAQAGFMMGMGPVGAAIGFAGGIAAGTVGQMVSAGGDSANRADLEYKMRTQGSWAALRSDPLGAAGYGWNRLGDNLLNGGRGGALDDQNSRMAVDFSQNPAANYNAANPGAIDIRGRSDVISASLRNRVQSGGDLAGIGGNLIQSAKERVIMESYASLGYDSYVNNDNKGNERLKQRYAAISKFEVTDDKGNRQSNALLSMAAEYAEASAPGGSGTESGYFSSAVDQANKYLSGPHGKSFQNTWNVNKDRLTRTSQAQLMSGQVQTDALSMNAAIDDTVRSGNTAGERGLLALNDLNNAWAQNGGSSFLFTDQEKNRAGGYYQYLAGGSGSSDVAKYQSAVGRIGAMTSVANVATTSFGMDQGVASTMLKNLEVISPIGRSGQATAFGVNSSFMQGIDPSSALGLQNSETLAGLHDGGFDTGALVKGSQMGVDMRAATSVASGYMKSGRGDLASNTLGNAQGALGMISGAMRYGKVSKDQSDALMGRALQYATDPNSWSTFEAVATGDVRANSLYADQSGEEWRRGMQTGSRGGSVGMRAYYDEAITSEFAGQRASRSTSRGYVRGDGKYSVSQLSSMNETDIDMAINKEQIGVRNYDFALQSRQLERSQAATRADYGFEDRGISLQRGQQDYQYQLQGQRLGLQKEQMDYGYQYQSQSMNIQHSHQQQEQKWGLENIGFQRNMSEVQFGYSMIDSDESIRYSTGRDRRTAMRHRDEAVVTHSMQAGQLDKEEERAKERIKWSDDQFQRDKQHFEKSHEFEVRNFQLTEQNYQKEREFLMQERQLDDEKRKYHRQIHELDMADERESMQVHQNERRTIDDLQGSMKTLRDMAAENSARTQEAAASGQLWSGTIDTLVQKMQQAANAFNSISFSTPTVYIPPTGAGGDPNSDSYHPPVGTPGASHPYADGGFTGFGGKHEPAGTVHKGEFVIPQQGAPVLVAPEHVEVLRQILNELKGIHSDGGNAVININQSNPNKASAQGMSLFDKAYTS